MQRRVFDFLLSWIGVVLVVVLLTAGGILIWASTYTNDNVRNQLAPQEIFFPTKAELANAKPHTHVTPSMVPFLKPYAGEQLLTGQQAKAYADHFIFVHLYQMPYHGVYAKVSAAAIASPNNKALQAEKATSFEGTTLRGLLLEAYGFSVVGTVTFWAAIASFILAGVMIVLTALGFWHMSRTSPGAELLGSDTRSR
jgi:hypothetical protein